MPKKAEAARSYERCPNGIHLKYETTFAVQVREPRTLAVFSKDREPFVKWLVATWNGATP